MTAARVHRDEAIHGRDGNGLKTAARIGLWLVACGALAAVALAYLNPQLMVELANRAWACL